MDSWVSEMCPKAVARKVPPRTERILREASGVFELPPIFCISNYGHIEGIYGIIIPGIGSCPETCPELICQGVILRVLQDLPWHEPNGGMTYKMKQLDTL